MFREITRMVLRPRLKDGTLDRRHDPRSLLMPSDFIMANYESRFVGPVLDLSGRGVSALLGRRHVLPKEGRGRLTCLGRSASCRFALRHYEGDTAGFRFLEKAEDFDEFLKPMLGSIRIGAGMSASRDADILLLEGAKGTRLVVTGGKSSTRGLEFNFRSSGSQCQLRYEKGVLAFGIRGRDPLKSATSRAERTLIYRNLVRDGLLILVGVKQAEVRPHVQLLLASKDTLLRNPP